LDRIGAKVDVAVEELLDDASQDVCIHHRRNLVAELELIQNLLHVRGEAVKIDFQVGFELLRMHAIAQVTQHEVGRVVERLT
jgi:hypothetical protein